MCSAIIYGYSSVEEREAERREGRQRLDIEKARLVIYAKPSGPSCSGTLMTLFNGDTGDSSLFSKKYPKAQRLAQ